MIREIDGVAQRPRRLDLQGPLAVDRPGEDLVARLAEDRHRLPRDRLLVDARPPGDDRPVDRDPLAGPDPDPVPRPELTRRDDPRRSVRPDDLGGLGRDLQQGPHGPPGPLQAHRLERLGQPEQEGHRRRLVPLPQGHGPGDRQAHQHVDVQPQPPQARTAFGTSSAPPAAIARA